MPAPSTIIERQEVGVVLSKRGKVTAKSTTTGEMRILKRGDILYIDDIVHTVRGANAQLKMDDQNIVMLRGGCAFRVCLYSPQDNSGNRGQRYEYIGGALRESRRESVPLMDLGIQ
ncbi:hypothetical protein [Thiothrix lacustris]|jgi:hypothetical protein|uniref:Uncharacterized protein n=1 Tax=Thiothrix lacustris TaxID=525917 RepID=A0ABY9MNB6_9GAMM|nr:hypothetical protein [Thiothrix lacustris]WML89700.1 hypothetical protein RCF98_12040 [Thiothrix lacustris]WMP18697.1 hypothetical protein RCS87_06470 [Thiothrix lacustris]